MQKRIRKHLMRWGFIGKKGAIGAIGVVGAVVAVGAVGAVLLNDT